VLFSNKGIDGMTNFIPLFPLGIVVFPGEKLNLHIFEPRYKQLICDCFEQKKPFGILPVVDNKVCEMGTLVLISEISNIYDDGKMDIKTEGQEIFKILEFIRELPDKMYSGAIVTYPENDYRGSASLMKKVMHGIRKIHESIGVSKNFYKEDEALLSYDVAHHAGLSMAEEYQLLEFMKELHRQEFLKRHLVKVLPVLKEMEDLRGKIKLNGHFKNLEGFKYS
jgi:hypothetical protein